MPKLPDEFIRQLQDVNDIVEMFRSYADVKKRGSTYVCCCPFHSEKTPSCTIYPENQSFYCFGCGVGGSAITFVQKMENVGFMEAVQILAQRSGMELPKTDPSEQKTADLRRRCLEINRETARVYFANLLKGSDRRGIEYFRQRQLSMETIKAYGLGFAPDDWGQLRRHLNSKGYSDEELVIAGVCRRSEKGRVYDYFRNRVMFPIIDLQGNVIAFGGRVLDDSKPKYLNTNDTPVFSKRRNLFSLHFAKKAASTTLILAEGYMDVIALHQAGFANAVATLGTSITDEQARLLSRFAKQVVISYDSDTAGQAATQRAIQYFSAVGIPVRILQMEGAKDPDEYIRKFGAERFRLLIENAGDVLNFQLDRCKEGLDLQTEMGQNEYLRRCVRILAEIDDPIRREVYCNRTAKEIGIRMDTLLMQVDRAVRQGKKNAGKIQFHAIEAQSLQRDELNPQAQQFPRESRAERMILAYLLKFPEDLEMVWDVVRPEDFVTEFHRKVYETVCQRIGESSEFSLSLLADVFSVEEMGRIMGIAAAYMEIIPDRDALEECAAVLRNVRNRPAVSDDLTDDDLRRLTEKRRQDG